MTEYKKKKFKDQYDIFPIGQLRPNTKKWSKDAYYGSFFIQELVNNLEVLRDLPYISIKVFEQKNKKDVFTIQAILPKGTLNKDGEE